MTARSEYFRSLFRSGLKESVTNEITLDDVEPEAFEVLLKYIYSGSVPSNIDEIAPVLLPMADRFQMVTLRDACESTIAGSLTPENVISMLLLAHSHSCSKLAGECLPVIRANMTTLKKTEDWKELKKHGEVVILVLESFSDCYDCTI